MSWIPYLLLSIIVLFLALQIGFWLSTRRLRGRSAPDVSDLVDLPAPDTARTLYYFYSEHCGPCTVMTPRIDALAERYPNIVKIDLSAERELSRRFHISVVPSILVVEEGHITSALVGRCSRRRLEALLAGRAGSLATPTSNP